MPKSRLLISSPETAIRLKQCTALLTVPLPPGFHALSLVEQERVFEEGVASAFDDVRRYLAAQVIRRTA